MNNLSLENMEEEIWKPIIGLEDRYSVSSKGRVKSIGRIKNLNGFNWEYKPFIRKQNEVRGYLSVLLYNKDKSIKRQVHVLVAQCFIENKENKPIVNHKDGNKKNNNISNLEWVTHSENQIHASVNGFRDKTLGENSNFSKLKKEVVLEIRQVYKEKKVSFQELSKRYNTAATNISSIINNKTWKYI